MIVWPFVELITINRGLNCWIQLNDYVLKPSPVPLSLFRIILHMLDDYTDKQRDIQIDNLVFIMLPIAYTTSLFSYLEFNHVSAKT